MAQRIRLTLSPSVMAVQPDEPAPAATITVRNDGLTVDELLLRVEGLDGKADLLKNGKITVSSLETWVAERVKELSEGTQTPTVAKPQTVPDFPIGLKR